MSLTFLLIGIDFADLGAVVGEENVEEWTKKIKGGLAKDEARFTALGLKYDVLGYGIKESMTKLEDKLKFKKYDGVCIGFGIRSTPNYTPLFEALVNTIATTSPGTKMLFNTSPDSTLDAARRQFPEIKEEQKEA